MLGWTLFLVFFLACNKSTVDTQGPGQKEVLHQELKSHVAILGIDGTALENAILSGDKRSARDLIEDLLDDAPIGMTAAEIQMFFDKTPAGITAFGRKVGNVLLERSLHPKSSFTWLLELSEPDRIEVLMEVLDSKTGVTTRVSHLDLIKSAIRSHRTKNAPERFMVLFNLLTIAELMDPI